MSTYPMPLVAPALCIAALLMPGCGDDPRTPDASRPAPTVTDAETSDAIETGTTGDRAWDAGDELNDALTRDGDQDADTPRPPSAPPAAEPNTDPAAGRVATFNGSARLPFPEEGERITEHLAFTMLADHDAFESPIDPADIPAVVPWEEAGQYVGHTITVEGKIVDIGQTRNASVFFLNFHQDWRGKFYMVVFEDLAETLEAGVEGTFLNKRVRVEGLVEDHRGRPQIKIESMDQVEFVEE